MTDLSRWRLEVDEGRQIWKYLSENQIKSAKPQTKYEKYCLGLLKDSPDLPLPKTAQESCINGFEFFSQLQTPDGHWTGEYGGPMFLLPGYIFACYICDIPLPEHEKLEIIRYLKNKIQPEGGWGIHIESPSSIFGTVLNYIVLRICGVDKNDKVLLKAKEFILNNGTATHIPSWGKFWLCLLNLYDWNGMNSIPPELWILPEFLPIHPSKMWCHTRAVYLPMSYLYGKKFQIKENDFIKELRTEIYSEDYNNIAWINYKNSVAKCDIYYPHSKLLDFLNIILNYYENYNNQYFRNLALNKIEYLIKKEDENTNYLCLAPVNKMMHVIISFLIDGKDSNNFKNHLNRLSDANWISQDGFFTNGTNGSQLWDTTFILQSIYESKLYKIEKFKPIILKALNFLNLTQIRKNPIDYKETFRQITKGAWPFSTRDQAYTVSDCTAEALKMILIYKNELNILTEKDFEEKRIFDAVDVLISMKNDDGGFATYEKVRSGNWLELLNPAEVFGNIMVEYTYVECTSAVLLALKKFQKYYSFYRSKEIQEIIKNGLNFIKNVQRPDGSFYGSWAICFTYGTWFGLEALAANEEYYYNSDHVKKACDFLISKQMNDGGWGESYKSCELHEYIQNEKSQVVNTSWALLSLMIAQYPDLEPINKGIKLLMKRQRLNGEWKQENIEGVFNHNCMISYPNYKFIFPILALGRYHELYE